MKKRDIFITQYDLERLKSLIADKRVTGGENACLKDLEDELDRARIVESKDIPGDVITMNSKVRLRDLEAGDETVLFLVFPADANIDEGKISILAPVGTGMIGYKVGDVLEWKVPMGMRKLEILEILYQPEAAGDFHL
jgi:regulator of nucleoside diphosphate kinase